VVEINYYLETMIVFLVFIKNLFIYLSISISLSVLIL